jgi:hypothetical protein
MVAWWLDYVVRAPKKNRKWHITIISIYTHRVGVVGWYKTEQAHQKSSTKNKGAQQKEPLHSRKKRSQLH